MLDLEQSTVHSEVHRASVYHIFIYSVDAFCQPVHI